MREKDVQKVIDWREAILKLPDQKFFDLMTFYLGEIKTPFNKQDLIDRLSAFLRKEDVQEKIFVRINLDESYLLSCIMLLPRADFNLLKNFFKGERNHYQVQELLNNLEQRLVVFRPDQKEKVYEVNPYLIKKFESLADLQVFLKPVGKSAGKIHSNLLSDINILSAYSFFLHNDNSVKNSGELKKKTFERMEKIFILYQNNLPALNYLLRAFFNLNLFRSVNNRIKENEKAWKQFSRLSAFERQCYIIAASTERYSEKYLTLLAKMTASFLKLLNPDYVYEVRDLEKAFTILHENLNALFLNSEILKNDAIKVETFFQNDDNKKQVIEAARMFGVLIEEEEGVSINPSLFEPIEQAENKSILVSPSFEVTVFPSNNLENLLPLVSALLPTSVQTTAVFELSRKTCGMFFECKGNYDSLKEIFLENINGELPQNIDISLKQWYQNFSAVKLYKGVIAIISPEKASLFGKGMPLERLVEKKLAENVFLLKMTNPANIREELDKTGLECLVEKNQSEFIPISSFSLPSFKKSKQQLPFAHMLEPKSKREKMVFKKDFISQKEKVYITSEKAKQDLIKMVKGLDLEKSEKDFLSEQVLRNIILDESQINSNNIKFESVQVSALDYSAKLHLCENAILQSKKLEITVEVKNKHKTFYCTPVEVKKTEKKDLLSLLLDDSPKIRNLDISKIAKIKMVKDSIF